MSARFTVDPGLCRTCHHGRVIATRRGSGFLHCGRSATDPSFPRYPRLPVVSCRGYEAAREVEGGDALPGKP